MANPYLIGLIALLLVPIALADDPYRPWIHGATVPEAPSLELYSKYQTNLFPGAATYTYSIEVPPGTSGFQPDITFSYNSQAIKQLPTLLGTGWSLIPDHVFRHDNFTAYNVSDDYFVLVLEGVSHDLVWDASDGFFHTEVDIFARVQNLTTTDNEYDQYWLVTTKEGVQHRFGYHNHSELVSNGMSRVVKWSLDQQQDVHGNTITYSYEEDPYAEDNGTAYLKSIAYNNDNSRKLELSYEANERPDKREVYQFSHKTTQSRRLQDVSVSFNGSLVRRYSLDYTTPTIDQPLTALSTVTHLGSDNFSILQTVSFGYQETESMYVDLSSQAKYDPPEAFVGSSGQDFGLRLVDVNKDGLVDILKGKDHPAGVDHRDAWINNGTGWVNNTAYRIPAGMHFVGSSHADMGVRIVDVNSDGFPDLLRGYGSSNLHAWISNGSGYYNGTATWAPPTNFVDTVPLPNDWGARFTDLNGDGRVDIVKRSQLNGGGAWLNTGNGWKDASSMWYPPTWFVKTDYSDSGLRIADVNGDGLPDLLQAYNSGGEYKDAWLNNGSGWVEAPQFEPPVVFTHRDVNDLGARLVDLNADGLIDILVNNENATSEEKSAWLNNGSGWVEDDDWLSPEPFNSFGQNIAKRIGDINGDGYADVIVGLWELQKTWVRNVTKPFILKNITNEFGGVTNINYESSTIKKHTGPDNLSTLGFNVWIVNHVVQDNDMNDFSVIANTSYNYANGLYDYEKQEFRGFEFVNESLPDNSTVAHFFNQDDARKGREYKVETYDADGSLLIRGENVHHSTDEGGYFTVELRSSSTHLFDGQATAQVTNTTLVYDEYGNVVEKHELGNIEEVGDEKYESVEFVYNTSAWIVDRVGKHQLFGNDNSTRVRETKYFYDGKRYGEAPSKGDVTKIVEFLNDKGGPTTQFEYDSFGNVVEQVDPLGRVTKFEYGLQDSTHTFADRVTNDLGHATDYVYDVGTGNLLSETKNDISRTFAYDTFGRIVTEIHPYDSLSFPTKNYTYFFDGNSPEIIKVSQKTTSNKSLDTYYFYDGFANVIQIKTPATLNRQIVKNIFYDELFRVGEEQNPYFDLFSSSLTNVSSTENKTKYAYDALSRITQVENPDGTIKSTSYDQWQINDVDENGNSKTYWLDSHERIIAVTEENVDFYTGGSEQYNTTYSYNAADELIGIKDTEGNTFNFTYDSLGRKTQLDDPDLGIWTYEYDLAGNLIRQTDNKGNEIFISYDPLNRILQKNSSSQIITFGYDEQYQGTLSEMSMNNNIAYEFTYDDRLRVVKEMLNARHHSFETGFTYDSLDRVLEKRLPDGDDFDYYYGEGGKLTTILGFINETAYNPFGNPLNRSYFNNKVTSFSYHTDNARLNQIKTGAVQELNYSYDNVGNVVAIDDGPNGRNYRMSYDDLDRLTNVSIDEFKWVYNFDPLGNILKIVRNFSETTSFKFDSGLAHAPSQVITGESGVDVYKVGDFNSSSKTKIFKFFLVNEKNESVNGANWTAGFGDGGAAESTEDFNLSKGENVLVIVEHDFSAGGDYKVNFTGLSSASLTDYENLDLLFGSHAKALSLEWQNATTFNFTFVIQNLNNNDSENWDWSCSSGSSAPSTFSMSTNEIKTISVQDSLALSDTAITCTVNSSDGNQSIILPISYQGIAIERYNSTKLDSDSVEVKFTIKNYHSSQDVSWNITGGNQVFQSGSPTTLGQHQEMSVTQQVDFTSGSMKEIVVTAYSNDFSDSYTEHQNVRWLVIENFVNKIKNGTSRILNFTIHNLNSLATITVVNTTSPIFGNQSNLGEDESVTFSIEHDYDQGDKTFTLHLFNSTSLDRMLLDMFAIRHIEIGSLETIHEADRIAVVHAFVKNNVANKSIEWSLNNSQELIISSEDFSLDQSETGLIIIESSFDEKGVYPLHFHVNSSTLNDNRSGVVVS